MTKPSNIAIGLLLVLGHHLGSAVAQTPLDVLFAELQQTTVSANNMPAGSYFMSDAQQLVLVFPLTPLEQPPTPPLGYTTFQMKRWNWLGGTGFLVLTRNNFGEHGVLTELMYFPGVYQPQCMLNTTTTAADAVPDAAALINLSNFNFGRGSSAVTAESSTLGAAAATAGRSADASLDSNDTADSRGEDGSSTSGSGLLSNSRDEDVTRSSDGIFSAQRFWVDMQVSQAVGRAYFGYPKEAATFKWTADSVTARNALGNIIFSAKFGNATNDAESLPAWVPEVATGKIATIQWPINDPLTRLLAKVVNNHSPGIEAAINKLPTDVQKMLRAGAAAAQLRADQIAQKANIRFLPNTQALSFPGYSSLGAAQVTKVLFNKLEFTGRNDQTVGLSTGSAGIIVGTPGALSDPVPYSCY